MKVKRNRKLKRWVKVLIGFIGGCLFVTVEKNFRTIKIKEDCLEEKIEIEEQSSAYKFENQSIPITLDQYRDINEHIFAVLIFNDENIERRIPIVEAKNEEMADYWMNHNIYNEVDSLGSAFLDAQTPLNQSNNLRINGHASYQNSRMFTFIQKYKDKSYFEQHPYFYYQDALSLRKYEVIFMANYEVESDRSYCAYWLNNWLQKQDIETMINQDFQQIICKRDFKSKDNETYITLVTCDMQNENYRYVLFAHEIERNL